MTKSSLFQHDSLFKKFLGNIAVARDFLEIHLPPHLRERCDLSTLAMESGCFIEDDLLTLSTVVAPASCPVWRMIKLLAGFVE